MAVFTRKTDSAGRIQYRNITTNERVSAENLDELLKEKLDMLPEGTEVSEDADIESNEATRDYIENTAESNASAKDNKVEINLNHPILINGIVYKKGTIRVSSELASDLVRIDNEHSEYEANLLRGHDRSKTHTQIRPQDAQEY